MEFTCLSEGKGFYFPACHIIDICGFRVLFDCPIDFSSLAMFSPIPLDDQIFTCSRANCPDSGSNEMDSSEIGKPLDAKSLIRAEPWYRIVKNLLLWNVEFIDVVLISSPMGMMGLPFLTRSKDFSAKVYVTEAAARIGQLMMEDVITMHKEYRQFYGTEDCGAPQWMKWEELESLPLELKRVACNEDGLEFGGWMNLYSAADVKDCMLKIESLKYAEEACYNGILIVKAFSSGLEIGSCNWKISGPKGTVSYISDSVLSSTTAMSFDYKALQKSDVIIYTDFLSSNAAEQFEGNSVFSNLSDDYVDSEASGLLLNDDEYSEEMEKLDFICLCSMDSVNAGGSVLIPIGRLGIILQLLERFAIGLESENIKVPIFVVSSVAEELMAFTNVIPEWLCKQRQERLYSGRHLFNHVEMLKDGRLHFFPAIHSLKLLEIWREPCIVFCPHWSLRLGPVTHLLRRWRGDQNSLLVMEEGVDASLALLPFQPMEMKVLQCSFISGIQTQKSRHLLKVLQPKHIVFRKTLRQHIRPLETSFQFSYYSKNDTLHIPNVQDDSELHIEIELAPMFHYMTLKDQETNIARLKGEFVIEQGKYRLTLENEQVSSPVVHFGRIDLDLLTKELQKKGFDVTVEEVTGEGVPCKSPIVYVISELGKAMIEVTVGITSISTGDESLASLISEAVCSLLNCI